MADNNPLCTCGHRKRGHRSIYVTSWEMDNVGSCDHCECNDFKFVAN